ncbi:hypothetical protein NDR87_25925 [Nocardia sp. CDC159]|uniref:Uncharacterized protein n=1 Tax=Nocardia pulmonis TaxID=2951408 RepID=A0A9X2E8M5_9NOCA|nr:MULTISPECIES: hypothetical protein [Nocardia]MCM6774885.1 hypothetical protein [Nocardia pulmonis]MCM6789816.1 hypothetical protein [Nocardia sp. CDC159]
MRRLWIVVDLALIVLCVGAAVPSWRNGIRTTTFAASEELPAFEATRYAGPWLALAALLVAVAGVAVVDLVARCAGRSR